MVDEASWAAHELAVDNIQVLIGDIIGLAFRTAKFVKRIEVGIFALLGAIFATTCFRVGDHLSSIIVDELALVDQDGAP